MARITRARVLKGDVALQTMPAVGLDDSGDRRRGRILPRPVADAHDEARRVVLAARQAATEILREAREQAERAARERLCEAEAAAEARFAAELVSLRAEDERRAERDLDRVIETAVVLAERLVGASLSLDPAQIAAMARTAISQARGARRLVLVANPLDAEALRAQLLDLGVPEGVISVEEQGALARGDLVLETNLGTVDARLKPQLQRLAEALSRAGARAGRKAE